MTIHGTARTDALDCAYPLAPPPAAPSTDWSPMRARRSLALALITVTTALTAGCTDQETRGTATGPGTTAPSWDGKAPQEDALRRATRALNAVEARRCRTGRRGVEDLARGLDKTFSPKATAPHTFDIACQAPADRTLTLIPPAATCKPSGRSPGEREGRPVQHPRRRSLHRPRPRRGPGHRGLRTVAAQHDRPRVVEGCETTSRVARSEEPRGVQGIGAGPTPGDGCGAVASAATRACRLVAATGGPGRTRPGPEHRVPPLRDRCIPALPGSRIPCGPARGTADAAGGAPARCT
ncbi:hypothetical protein LT493_39280 [Streptomyces tricolor]|nr:hypothetical protein [Streptomyces tricolor]